MSELTVLERAVLEKLLEGDHIALESLRRQIAVLRVIERDMTGVGFFTTLGLPEERKPAAAPLTQRHIRWGDVAARVPGLQHGAGFVLFIEEGYLQALEGYSFDEPWPASIPSFELAYEGAVRDFSALC